MPGQFTRLSPRDDLFPVSLEGDETLIGQRVVQPLLERGHRHGRDVGGVNVFPRQLLLETQAALGLSLVLNATGGAFILNRLLSHIRVGDTHGTDGTACDLQFSDGVPDGNFTLKHKSPKSTKARSLCQLGALRVAAVQATTTLTPSASTDIDNSACPVTAGCGIQAFRYHARNP